jgi:glucokinase
LREPHWDGTAFPRPSSDSDSRHATTRSRLAFSARPPRHAAGAHLSIPGIVALYTFLRDVVGPEPAPVRARFATAPIRRRRLARSATRSAEQRRARCSPACWAPKAGGLAEIMALGGVFIAGGIAPKVLPALTRGSLREAFLDKGRQRALLERLSIHVSSSRTPAARAARLAHGTASAAV